MKHQEQGERNTEKQAFDYDMTETCTSELATVKDKHAPTVETLLYHLWVVEKCSPNSRNPVAWNCN